MAQIRPFFCIRPCREKAARIAALPYDVYSRAEAKQVTAQNPDSFLNIDRPETQFADDADMYDDKVYQKAREMLWKQVEDRTFLKEEKRCYYIYELTNKRTQTGIVACASIDDYENQVIKKHENTRQEKEADRIRHVDTCNAQTGPIFLAYRADQGIRTVVQEAKKQEPLYDFVAEDGVRHRVFRIFADEQIREIQQAFAKMESIYIADGHHRAASAVKVGQMRKKAHPGCTGEEEFCFFLSVLFPDDELMIMDYNRVVKDLGGLSPAQFLDKAGSIFDLKKVSGNERRPKKKGDFSMYLDGSWYMCSVRAEDLSADPVKSLDVSLLQDLLLEPVLGIHDPKTDQRIDFIGGIRGLDELERRVETDCAVAFAMYPTDISELFAVADAGLLMPPKSTWFEPKLRSGLFIHALDE